MEPSPDSEDTFVCGVPVEIFSDIDVNMDHVVEIAPDGQIIETEEEEVPDAVASETVITTPGQLDLPSGSGTTSRSLVKFEGCSEWERGDVADSRLTIRSLLKKGANGLVACETTGLLPIKPEMLTTPVTGSSVLTASGRYDVQCTHLVNLSPDGKEIIVTDAEPGGGNPEMDPAMARKRAIDRIKKRRLRENPAFREQEKVGAKSRMRALRSDPEYRQKEREKDRIRRRLARQRNLEEKKFAERKPGHHQTTSSSSQHVQGRQVQNKLTGSSPAVPGHVFSADKYQQRDAVLLKLQEESVEEFSDEVAPFTSRQIKEITETFVGSHKTDNLALFPKHSSSEKRLVILSPDAKNDGTSASIRNILQSPGNSVRTERTRGSQTRGSVGQRPRPDGDQRHVSGLGNARTS